MKKIISSVMFVSLLLLTKSSSAVEVGYNCDAAFLQTMTYDNKEYILLGVQADYPHNQIPNLSYTVAISDYFVFEIDGSAKKDYWVSLVLGNIKNMNTTGITAYYENTSPLVNGWKVLKNLQLKVDTVIRNP